MRLEGARVLVTGGAVRVGRAIALGLADRGAAVAIGYHSSAGPAQETAAELRRRTGVGHAFRADVAVVAEAHALVAQAADALGGLDVLVNAASGGFSGARPEELDERSWDVAHGSTLKGTFFCSQAARRAMGDSGGVIVNIADVAGIEPWPLFAAHGAAKAGVVYLTKALAAAWGPSVRVVGVAPGPVLMPEGSSVESHRRSAEETALKRLGGPDDVVGAVVYLIGADYVTGQQVVVDGGQLLL